MEEDLEAEEASLMLLQNQLGAVKHIRKELEKKDDQIQSLRVELAEAACFRDQAINLRTQLRIMEERMHLLESARQETMSQAEQQEHVSSSRLRCLEEEKKEYEKREAALKKLLEERVEEEKMMQLEVEQGREMLRDMTHREAEAQNEAKTLGEDLRHYKFEVSTLHDILNDLREEVRAKEEELHNLRPTCEHLKQQAEQMSFRLEEIEVDASRVPLLESKAEEADALRAANMNLQEQLMIQRANTESDKMKVASLTSELENLRSLVVRQERYIEQVDESVLRARTLDDEIQKLKQLVTRAQKEGTGARVVVSQLSLERTKCLAAVEKLLAHLCQGRRKDVTSSSEEGGQSSDQASFDVDVMGEAEGQLWSGLEAIQKEVVKLMRRNGQLSHEREDLEQHKAQVETEAASLKARAEDAETALVQTTSDLQDARAATQALDKLVSTLRRSVEELEATTDDLREEIHCRDAFLRRLADRLVVPSVVRQSMLVNHLSSSGAAAAASSPEEVESESVDGLYDMSPRHQISSLDFERLQVSISEGLGRLFDQQVKLQESHRSSIEEANRREREAKAKLKEREGMASQIQEQLNQVIESSRIAQEHAKSHMEEVLMGLKAKLEEATQALQVAIDQREVYAISLDRARQDLVLSNDWNTRAALSLSVVGRVFNLLMERYHLVCAQKRLYLKQSCSSTRLSLDIWILAMAVSGDYAACCSPRLSSSWSPSMLRGNWVPTFRSVVIAVLFANRLSPRFRYRLESAAESKMTVNPPTYDEHLSLCRVGSPLPSNEEIDSLSLSKAALLILRRLKSLDAAEDSRGPGGFDSVSGHDESSSSLLLTLARGGTNFRRSVKQQQGLIDGTAEGTSALPIVSRVSVCNDVLHLYRGDLSGQQWAMPLIRRGFLAMARSLTQLSDNLAEVRLANEVLAATLSKHREESKGQEDHVRILTQRLEAFEVEKAGILGDAESSVQQLQDRLAEALKEIKELEERSWNAEESLETQLQLVEQEKCIEKQLRDEVAQWRRYALRCQKEIVELQQKASRDAKIVPTTQKSQRSYHHTSPSPYASENAWGSPASKEGGQGQAGGEKRDIHFDEIESLLNRLAKAEQSLDGTTTHSDALARTLRQLLMERMQHNQTLEALRGGQQTYYEHNERLTGQSDEVLKDLNNMRRQSREGDARRGREESMDAQRLMLLKQQKEAQKELEEALKGMGNGAKGAGGDDLTGASPAASYHNGHIPFSLSSLSKTEGDAGGWL